jgi:hypothetical protein
MTYQLKEQHRLLEVALSELREASHRVIAHTWNLDNAVRKVDIWPSYHERAALNAARKEHRKAMAGLRKAQKAVTAISINLAASTPESVA